LCFIDLLRVNLFSTKLTKIGPKTMTTITTNNFIGCPTASFSDLLASKLSHTDVVSSDIQHAMKSLFGNETVGKITRELTSNSSQLDSPFYAGEKDDSEAFTPSKIDWANVKVNNNENPCLSLDISFGKNEITPRTFNDFISEEFIFNTTKDIFGKGLTLSSLSGCITTLDDSDVDKVCYEFSISKLGIINTERLIEEFFRTNNLQNKNSNLLFDRIYNSITYKPSQINPELPIFKQENTESSTVSAVIKELGAYKSIKSKRPDLDGGTISTLILSSLVKLCEEVLNLVGPTSQKEAYPIFMRRMLLSQFQY